MKYIAIFEVNDGYPVDTENAIAHLCEYEGGSITSTKILKAPETIENYQFAQSLSGIYKEGYDKALKDCGLLEDGE